MIDDKEIRQRVATAAATAMRQSRPHAEPSATVIGNTYGLVNALYGFVTKPDAEDAATKLAAIDMAVTTAQDAKLSAEPSAGFAGNVLDAATQYYAFLSGKKDVMGSDHLGQILNKS